MDHVVSVKTGRVVGNAARVCITGNLVATPVFRPADRSTSVNVYDLRRDMALVNVLPIECTHLCSGPEPFSIVVVNAAAPRLDMREYTVPEGDQVARYRVGDDAVAAHVPRSVDANSFFVAVNVEREDAPERGAVLLFSGASKALLRTVDFPLIGNCIRLGVRRAADLHVILRGRLTTFDISQRPARLVGSFDLGRFTEAAHEVEFAEGSDGTFWVRGSATTTFQISPEDDRVVNVLRYGDAGPLDVAVGGPRSSVVVLRRATSIDVYVERSDTEGIAERGEAEARRPAEIYAVSAAELPERGRLHMRAKP